MFKPTSTDGLPGGHHAQDPGPPLAQTQQEFAAFNRGCKDVRTPCTAVRNWLDHMDESKAPLTTEYLTIDYDKVFAPTDHSSMEKPDGSNSFQQVLGRRNLPRLRVGTGGPPALQALDGPGRLPYRFTHFPGIQSPDFQHEKNYQQRVRSQRHIDMTRENWIAAQQLEGDGREVRDRLHYHLRHGHDDASCGFECGLGCLDGQMTVHHACWSQAEADLLESGEVAEDGASAGSPRPSEAFTWTERRGDADDPVVMFQGEPQPGKDVILQEDGEEEVPSMFVDHGARARELAALDHDMDKLMTRFESPAADADERANVAVDADGGIDPQARARELQDTKERLAKLKELCGNGLNEHHVLPETNDEMSQPQPAWYECPRGRLRQRPADAISPRDCRILPPVGTKRNVGPVRNQVTTDSAALPGPVFESPSPVDAALSPGEHERVARIFAAFRNSSSSGDYNSSSSYYSGEDDDSPKVVRPAPLRPITDANRPLSLYIHENKPLEALPELAKFVRRESMEPVISPVRSADREIFEEEINVRTPFLPNMGRSPLSPWHFDDGIPLRQFDRSPPRVVVREDEALGAEYEYGYWDEYEGEYEGEYEDVYEDENKEAETLGHVYVRAPHSTVSQTGRTDQSRDLESGRTAATGRPDAWRMPFSILGGLTVGLLFVNLAVSATILSRMG